MSRGSRGLWNVHCRGMGVLQERRWYDRPRSRLIGRLTGQLPGTNPFGLLKYSWKSNGMEKAVSTRTSFGRKLDVIARNTFCRGGSLKVHA